VKVEIWSDVACPWCWVGRRRFERALARFELRDEVEVVWRSFELDPSAPRVHEASNAERLAAKYGVSVEQARAMNERVAGEGRKEGLDLRLEGVRAGNTFDAHRLIHFADAHGLRDAMIDRLYAAYFTESAAIGEADTLVRLASEAGLDADAARAMLAGDAHADDVRADEARARELGIGGVPFFAIDERWGVSGAQPAEVLLDALRTALRESDGVPG
jgi:predicted DsbA family dithiol-disulfide isomerase